MNGGQTTPLNMETLESSGSYQSLPDETRRGPLEQAFRRRTVRDVLTLVDDLDEKAEFAPLERAYVVYTVLKTTGARPISRTATRSDSYRSGAARTPRRRGDHGPDRGPDDSAAKTCTYPPTASRGDGVRPPPPRYHCP